MSHNYQPVSPEKHRHAGWISPSRYFYAAQDVVVPVAAAELSHLLTSMPLAFVHADDNAPFELVAVQSLQPGVNAYVAPDGRWLGQYIPAFYRSYPFRLLAIETSKQTALCADSSQNCFFTEANSEQATPLFDDQGQISEALAKMKRFIETFEKNRRETQQRVAALDEAGLIEPWNVHLSHGDDVRQATDAQPVKGLYRINEAKLKALPAEQLQALIHSGAIALAYAQLLSEQRLQHVGRRYRLHTEWQRHLDENTNIAALLDEEDDDTIFDFGD